MAWIQERIISWVLSKIKGRTPSHYKEMQEYYQSRIDFMKKELEDQKKIIESFRYKHPNNGEELDAWASREEKLNQEKIQMMKQIFELTGQLNFTIKELEKCYKKATSSN